ncbi:MAG: hypothetical protein CSA74_03500 [Rhodobacterales bacterium]|nr:MAG: hypothetical protein CSA74_03500 [Rhodobacterales bacterium]
MVAGEFSSGKTQLINGLAGTSVLPSNVTATALPPVWLVGGASGLAQVNTAGRLRRLEALDQVVLDTTQFCVLGHSAPILQRLDIIDTPGNSDPNMDAASWKRMLDYADAVIWCTNATQAWRQTEKAVWRAMPERLRRNAILIITHADLLGDEANAGRVLQRVEREAADIFDMFLMVSLLDAADVDGVREHVQYLSDRIEISGADSPAIDEFTGGRSVSRKPAREAGKTSRPSRAMQMIRPRRVKTPAPEPHAKAPASPKVVPIPVTAPPAQPAESKSKIRVVWTRLLENVDRNDPVAIMKAAERLVSILERDSGMVQENKLKAMKASGGTEQRPDAGRGYAAAAEKSE